MAISIDVKDNATPAVKEFLASTTGPKMNGVVGLAGANEVKNYLFALNGSRPNKLGGKRTNFYADAARSTQYQVTVDGAVVSINKLGFRQRLQGGTISPRNVKFLTIPAIAEAYGKRAREFPNLHFEIVNGQPALVDPARTEIRFTPGGKVRAKFTIAAQPGATGTVVYWLARKVTQRADPSILPSGESLGSAVARAIESRVREAARKANGQR